MSLRSPRSPRNLGFVPIAGRNSAEMQEIPLTTIRSNASSSGARKANQTLLNSDMDGNDEKGGLFPTPAGRRRVERDLKRAGSSMSEETSLNAMGRLYNKIVGFSAVTRYLFYVVPVALLLAIPLVILPFTGDGDKDRVSLGGTSNSSLFRLFLWIEISWLSLWVGKVVAHLLPPIFMFFCGVISSGTRKYATVLRALEIPFSMFFWALSSWLVFKFMIMDKLEWVDTITRILLSLFLSSAVLLGEKAIVQLISITYHQRSFANRIHDSKHEIRLLGLMYDASRTLFPMYCPEFAEEDYIINDSIDMILSNVKLRKGKQGGAATPMRLLGDVGRFGDKITSVFGNIASDITGKQVFNPNSAHSIVVEALEKVRSSEAMARRIWMSFVVEGKESLSLEDISEVLGPAHHEEAEECFNAIDADQNGDISLDEMVRKVVEIGKERKAIANSMKDISQALTVFDKVLLFVVLLIVIIIFLAVFQSSFIATLTTAGTTLLSLSFVFAVTTQEFLGSCIFLFVKHPYDVGDRVDITGPEKEQLVVEKISLLYTVFTRIDKMQVVQVPNIILNNQWIENVTRSKAMKEVIDVNVSFDTPFEDIELLRLEIEKFVRSPENSRDFQPDVTIAVGGVGDLDKLTLKIAIKHKSNWHNDAVRGTRRSKFLCALALALKLVPINGPGGGGEPLGGPKNPAYNVAVSDDFAAVAREKADKEKAAKKLANSGMERSLSGASTRTVEKHAAEQLNTSNPVIEALDDWAYDDTLNSREASADRKRAVDVEGVRRDFQNARDSQRGRRKAGDTLPLAPVGEGAPGLRVTRADTNRSNRSFDLERQDSVEAPLSQYPAAMYAAGAVPTPALYSNIPPPPPPPPPVVYAPNPANLSIQTNLPLPQHPLQNAPSGAVGARARGASVIRALAQQQINRETGNPTGNNPGPSNRS
ncbi:Mechanosensitive ion channel-domain-containing protein [Lasiosphaeria miniovina]|uniref:Mechanosensitive ion channel-domain-containing protein n=1 Tax=Lasiosphaeria miniovina TaxID=1954250 RepID=A0AA40AWB8_9PEZI|nr:Mechanosensitive ion channel-domain-containing protein [Lasiosphaeria miniovina]KAK0723238.1 Mechanosensitive ion channel-domain-containing protein [Lasiosphaeria miniovina]